MGRAAEGIEAVGISIGVEMQGFDADTGRAEAMLDVSRQIEMRFAVRVSSEEAIVLRIGLDETLTEGRVDLIRRLGDRGTDGGADPLADGSQPLHRGDGRFIDARDSAPPAGMRRGGDAGLGIRQKHRRAVRAQNAEQQSGTVRDHGVRAGPLVLRPGAVHVDDLGGMDLVHCRKLGPWKQRGDSPTTILVDRRAVVVAAIADVQPGKLTGRYAASPAEDAKGYSGKRFRAEPKDLGPRRFRMIMSWSA